MALLLSSLTLWGRPQIYVGLQCGVSNTKHVLTLGKQGWNELLLQSYKDSLENKTSSWISRVKDGGMAKTPPYWILNGTPKNLFQDLLDDKSSEISRRRLTSFDIRATLGAYLFRHEKMLFAAEIFAGGASFSSQQNSQQPLLDADVPQDLLSAYQQGLFRDQNSTGSLSYDVKNFDLNPMANSLRPYMYVRPNTKIQAKNAVEVTAHFLCGGAIRLGTLLKDRVFLYALLGAQSERFSLNTTLTLESSLPTLQVFYYASSYASAYDENVTFGVDTINPDASVSAAPRQFKKSKMKWGILGGFGLEFYINHRLALRTDVTMTYYTDLNIKAQDDVSLLKLTHKPWRIGLGLVYRFA